MSFWFVLGFALLVLVFFVLPRTLWIRVSTARSLFHAGAKLVDVRSPAEFRESPCPASTNIPIGEFRKTIESLNWPKDTLILLYCASGTRSGMALRQLRAMGFTQAFNLGTVGRAQQVAAE